jgi:hypothetical protein
VDGARSSVDSGAPPGDRYVGYGVRQNMDFDNPKNRFYAERVITNLVSHYKDNPAVIGWQIDNETSGYGASNPDVFTGFVEHLKKKFGTTVAMQVLLVPTSNYLRASASNTVSATTATNSTTILIIPAQPPQWSIPMRQALIC